MNNNTINNPINQSDDYLVNAIHELFDKVGQKPFSVIFITKEDAHRLKDVGVKTYYNGGFYFVDSIQYPEIANKYNSNSIIPLYDIKGYLLTPEDKAELRKLGARYSEKYHLPGKFWFIPQSLAGNIEQFERFTELGLRQKGVAPRMSAQKPNPVAEQGEFTRRNVSTNNEEQAGLATEQVDLDNNSTQEDNQQVEKFAYMLDEETMKIFFGENLNGYKEGNHCIGKFRQSVIEVCLYLLSLTKGNYYNQKGYINYSNAEIAKAVGYSSSSVSRAIALLEKSEEEGGYGFISNTIEPAQCKGGRERRIVFDESVLSIYRSKKRNTPGKNDGSFQIPYFKNRKLSRAGNIVASKLAGKHIRKIKNGDDVIYKKHFEEIVQSVGSRSNYYRRVKELKEAGIIAIEDGVIRFTQGFLKSYCNTYKKLMGKKVLNRYS